MKWLEHFLSFGDIAWILLVLFLVSFITLVLRQRWQPHLVFAPFLPLLCGLIGVATYYDDFLTRYKQACIQGPDKFINYYMVTTNIAVHFLVFSIILSGVLMLTWTFVGIKASKAGAANPSPPMVPEDH